MKIVIIAGSTRASSRTLKICQVLQHYLEQRQDVETRLYDLHKKPISIEIDKVWQTGTSEFKAAESLIKTLEWADGFVVASPEWDGMACPGLKNLFNHAGKSMAHKAALLVTVSSGRGGAYPISELRASSYKNTRICYVPENLIVRHAADVFNGNSPEANNESDVFYHRQANYALDLLLAYTKALNQVRAANVIDHETFANGM